MGLEVDPHLERLVLTLASAKRKGRLAEATAAVASSPSSPYLLPPRDLEKHPLHSHPLTVCLDVDGTLTEPRKKVEQRMVETLQRLRRVREGRRGESAALHRPDQPPSP